MFRAAAARVLSDTSHGNNNNDAESNLTQPFVVLGAAGAACLVLVLFCGFAVWLRRRCGWTRQSGAELDSPPRGTEGERLQVQQEMENEQKLEAIKQKRKARRRKYKHFLAPYTLVSEDRWRSERAEMMRMRTKRLNCDCGNSNMLVSVRQIGGSDLIQRDAVSIQNGTRRNVMQCNETK